MPVKFTFQETASHYDVTWSAEDGEELTLDEAKVIARLRQAGALEAIEETLREISHKMKPT